MTDDEIFHPNWRSEPDMSEASYQRDLMTFKRCPQRALVPHDRCARIAFGSLGLQPALRLLSAYVIGAMAVPCMAAPPDPLTAPIASAHAAQWIRPITPVRIHGDTYYVGFSGLSVVLIKTSAGLILIDGALPQSVTALESNLQKLSFDIKDVRAIFNTEAHFDHSGGIAALTRDSGAQVMASAAGAEALRRGRVREDDPQSGEIDDFPAVARVRAMRDGETWTLGGTTITAHATPGHTPGSMSWSWVSCEGSRCVNIVFGASLNAVSRDSYQFGDVAHLAALANFRNSVARFKELPCDILVTAHPDHSAFEQKLASGAFVDPQACRAYAAKYAVKLDERLTKEAAIK